MTKIKPIPNCDAPGLRIRTDRGWELVGGPLAPTPPLWGRSQAADPILPASAEIGPAPKAKRKKERG